MRPFLRNSVLTLAGAIAVHLTLSTSVLACEPDPYVGSICFTANSYCPRDYEPANGGLLRLDEYQLLYAVIYTTYGGDGRTTVGLPDLQAREAIGQGQGPGLSHYFPGMVIGYDQYHIPLPYIPRHSHAIDTSKIIPQASVAVSAASADLRSPEGNVWAAQSDAANTMYAASTNTTMAPGIVQAELSATSAETGETPAGNQNVFSPLGPQTGMLVCIAVNGQYPPRP